MYPTRRRCEKSVSPGFLLLCGWFAWACGGEALFSVLLAAGVHELGHLLVLRLFGAGVYRFHVGVLGAVMEADTAALSYQKELLAVLAGPLANLALASALVWTHAAALVGANLVLCAFNLLPLPPLDGGRALGLLLSWILGPERGEAVTYCIGRAAALTLAAFLLFLMVGTGGSLWLLPACLAALGMVGKKTNF